MVELPEVVVRPDGLADQLGIEDVGRDTFADRFAPVLQDQSGLAEQAGIRDIGNGTFAGTQNANFARRDAPPYLTRAVVVINGALYYEWTAVWVKIELGSKQPRQFRLTCSEAGPWATDWAYLRIRPGDRCDIYLDGYLMISNGYVTVRQVYYDATQHQIQIQGEDWFTKTTKAPVVSETGEFKGKTLKEYAEFVGKQFGVPVEVGVGVPNLKFPRISTTHSETGWESVEKHARALGVWMATNRNGAMVLTSLQGLAGGLRLNDAELIEGYNIVSARETIQSKAPTKAMDTGQAPGSRDASGAEVAHQRKSEGNGPSGVDQLGSGKLPSTILSEIPAWGINFLEARRDIENNVDDAFMINVQIVHVGWQRPNSGGIWELLDQVFVDSPMLIMKRALLVKSATFTQDRQGGTKTTLELVNHPSMKAQS